MTETNDAPEAKTAFAIETKTCFETYASPEDRAAMRELAGRYIDFLSSCKTERETVQFVRKALTGAGFQESADGEFDGDAVFRVLRGKTVFIARKGKKPLREGFRLVGAHCDTPRIDLKQRPLYQDCGVAQLKTHYYG
ncbi:MAG TPA: aminopeptidase, partial [Desulfovibrio sp.]|nr:aminopeptidase [Desulfovibrio sp.]